MREDFITKLCLLFLLLGIPQAWAVPDRAENNLLLECPSGPSGRDCVEPAALAQAEAGLLQDQFVTVKDGINIRRWAYQSDGLRVYGEFYLPAEGAARLPLVVFSHDGISGISKEHRLSCVRIAQAGYAVFAPSYRGEDGSDGVIEIAKGEVNDVLNALPLLKRHPRVDPDRIALGGASHGALISVLAASRQPDQVKALVVAYGVMDIYKWWYYLRDTGRLGGDPITARTYGKGPKVRPRSFAIRNALDVVSKLNCPVLILQGSKDKIVPEEQAHIMASALKKHGKEHKLLVYPDCLHGFLVYVPFMNDPSIEKAEKEQTEKAWKAMLKFLDEQLKGPQKEGN